MNYVVTVEIEVDPRHLAAFAALVRENARRSRDSEPGCRQFDVCLDPARPNAVFLYERYSDRAAFEAHLASAHFREFDTAAQGMIAAKAVRTLQRVDPD
jgi:quinol monooxygenase YgiN